MSLTIITFIIVFAAIFVLFVGDMQSILKKLASNRVLRFIFPFLIGSFLVFYLQWHVDLVLLWLRVFSFSCLYFLTKLLPFYFDRLFLEKIIFLSFIASVPLVCRWGVLRFNFNKKSLHWLYHISLFLWVFFLFLVIYNTSLL